jgi:hypothetical protein
MKIDPYSRPGLEAVEANLLHSLNLAMGGYNKPHIESFDEFDESNETHIIAWNRLTNSQQVAIRLLVTVRQFEKSTLTNVGVS